MALVFLQMGEVIIVTDPFTVLPALGTSITGMQFRVHTESVFAVFFPDFAGNDIVSATVLRSFTTIYDNDDISVHVKTIIDNTHVCKRHIMSSVLRTSR